MADMTDMTDDPNIPASAGVAEGERRYDRLPEPGEPILTSDGRPFGIVKQVHGGYIEIDREGDPDYWLSDAYIASSDGDRLYLRVPLEEADTHRLRRPGLESVGQRQVGLGTSLDTDLEALRTRELMEQELIAQRGTMDTGLKR